MTITASSPHDTLTSPYSLQGFVLSVGLRGSAIVGKRLAYVDPIPLLISKVLLVLALVAAPRSVFQLADLDALTNCLQASCRTGLAADLGTKIQKSEDLMRALL